MYAPKLRVLLARLTPARVLLGLTLGLFFGGYAYGIKLQADQAEGLKSLVLGALAGVVFGLAGKTVLKLLFMSADRFSLFARHVGMVAANLVLALALLGFTDFFARASNVVFCAAAYAWALYCTWQMLRGIDAAAQIARASRVKF